MLNRVQHDEWGVPRDEGDQHDGRALRMTGGWVISMTGGAFHMTGAVRAYNYE